jgi:type IV secretory pathway VirB10-like protein
LIAIAIAIAVGLLIWLIIWLVTRNKQKDAPKSKAPQGKRVSPTSSDTNKKTVKKLPSREKKRKPSPQAERDQLRRETWHNSPKDQYVAPAKPWEEGPQRNSVHKERGTY